ncbi:uncharacterized protein LOC112201338 [Rosa chinensis]|uniref:uncharacterized protein LOC112201338 n=1 Tax=Rosa chinensis TaxID=74649 RepID=UPI000D09346E|nr:uncharacterized protein LOC112201338 [Rosa chinensis]
MQRKHTGEQKKQKNRRSGGDHVKTKQIKAVLRATDSEFGGLGLMPRKSTVQQKENDGGVGVRDLKKRPMEIQVTGTSSEVGRFFRGLRDQRTTTSSSRGSRIRVPTKSQDHGRTSSARSCSESRSSQQTYSTIQDPPNSQVVSRRTYSNLSVRTSSYGSYQTSSSSNCSTSQVTPRPKKKKNPSNSKVESRDAAIKIAHRRQGCGVGAVVLCGLVRAVVLL